MPREPLPPPIEPPRTVFLQRAAPIIASERGLTPRARVLLESLAKDMALGQHDLDEAMAILQSGEAIAVKSLNPQRARFREYLKRQLGELASGILSARHEQKLATFAVTQLNLDDDSARDEIRAVAGELGLRRVPLEEALRFLEDTVAQKVGDGLDIDDATLWRLYVLGRDWGLDSPDIDELVRFRIEENKSRQKRDKLWSTGLVAGVIGAAALVLLVLIGIAVRSYFYSPQPDVAGESRPTAGDPETPRHVSLPEWWDADLAIAISEAKNNREDFGPVHEALAAEQAERRGQGYELLIDRASAEPFDYRTWRPLEPIVIGAYALEPDDAAAQQLLAAWLQVPRRVIDAVPPSPNDYQAAIRPVNAAAKAIKENRLPNHRRQRLVDDLGALLRTSLDPNLPEADLQRTALAALAAVLLEKLADAVDDRPEVLDRHYATLSALARDRLPAEEQARLDAILAAAAIEHAPQSWQSWEGIALRGIETRDSLAVLRIVDAFARCTHTELRRTLAPRLLARAGVSPAGLSTDEYASAIRQALGASLPAEAGDAARWSRLQERAEIVLQASAVASTDDAASLEQTAELAWHVNLAMGLAAARPNPAQFDQWLEAGPPGTAKPDDEEASSAASPPAVGGDRLPRDQQQLFDRYIHELGDWQKLEEPVRLSYLRTVARLAERVPDLSPIQSRQLATYLLGRKGDDEFAQLIDVSPSLRVWKQLRIALADGAERAPLADEQLARLALVFTGREVAVSEKNRAPVRIALLRSVVEELSGPRTDARGMIASNVDRWAAELAGVYRERARLLGAPPQEVESARDVSSSLRLALDRLGSGRGDGALDPAERLAALAERIPQSDAQATVLVQRALIQRALADIARRRPERQAEAQKLAEALRSAAAPRGTALAQLREGEATLLQLWLLLR